MADKQLLSKHSKVAQRNERNQENSLQEQSNKSSLGAVLERSHESEVSETGARERACMS